ncbi:mechanosensitive ion channel family protein [Listeria costaricensis]|uniref:mechanosensitive ion channel family protein n=1 Tax=Listeria costaricensis TaxID=2026604 RepID=UPI000C08897A|nr:mechanosensitive ion channel family protein [Listeria costaricensis]
MNQFNKWLASIDWDAFWGGAISLGIRIVILVLLYIVLKFIGSKLIRGFFKRYRENQAVSPSRSDTLESLIMNLYGYVLFFIFAILLLQNFMDVTALIASAGVASLAIAFGAQGLVSDVVTGFFILLERQLDVGDSITIGLINGNVEALGLRTTQVRDFDGTLHFIPNRQIMIVSNHSRGNMRVMVDVEISPTADTEKAMQVIGDVCQKMAAENKNIVEPPVVLGVQNAALSGVTIRIVGKAVNGEQFGVERDLLKACREALAENDIPFPLPYVAPILPENA